MSRDPAKAKPLSANVKRMMWLERAAPKNDNVISERRIFTTNDTLYCHKQGMIFMEACAMGISMKEFVPLYMTSQLAGVIDYNFSSSNGMNTSLSELLQIPMLLQNPRTIIETLYWIEDILADTDLTDNKSLVLSQAYEEHLNHTPKALLALPKEENKNIDELSYAYWLGYIYRFECILHDESSRMVYSAFSEAIMEKAYRKLLDSPINEKNLSDSAMEICQELDRLLVEVIWPDSNQKKYV